MPYVPCSKVEERGERAQLFAMAVLPKQCGHFIMNYCNAIETRLAGAPVLCVPTKSNIEKENQNGQRNPIVQE